MQDAQTVDQNHRSRAVRSLPARKRKLWITSARFSVRRLPCSLKHSQNQPHQSQALSPCSYRSDAVVTDTSRWRTPGQALPGRQRRNPSSTGRSSKCPMADSRLARIRTGERRCQPSCSNSRSGCDASGLGNAQPIVGMASRLGIDSTAANPRTGRRALPIRLTVFLQMDARRTTKWRTAPTKSRWIDGQGKWLCVDSLTKWENATVYPVVDSVGGAIAKKIPGRTANAASVRRQLIDGDVIQL